MPPKHSVPLSPLYSAIRGVPKIEVTRLVMFTSPTVRAFNELLPNPPNSSASRRTDHWQEGSAEVFCETTRGVAAKLKSLNSTVGWKFTETCRDHVWPFRSVPVNPKTRVTKS